MKKVFVLDVDGVIVGKQKGFNFPLPHTEVIQEIKILKEKGHHVILCTGRAMRAIKPIIEICELEGPHISDAGTLIGNPVEGKIHQEITLNWSSIQEVLTLMDRPNYTLELYTSDNYYVRKMNPHIEKHSEILGFKPKIIDSFNEVSHLNIIKIFLIVDGLEEKKEAQEMYSKVDIPRTQLKWTTNQNALPAQYAWFLPTNSGKGLATKWISKYLNISLDNFIGAGDNLSDWDFMKICKYKVAMGNALDDLKTKIANSDNEIITESVDQHGIIKAFKTWG